MMILCVRKADGLVVRRRSCHGDLPAEDAEFRWIEQPADYDPSFAHRLVRKRLVRTVILTDAEVLAARFAELSASDWRAAGDRTLEPEWAAYRQALRDITKDGRDAAAMLAAFPRRPDGTDAIAHLRQG